ncbi:MAG: glycosyltransferase family 9 protein [Bdellovibrionales bacterium]
MNYLLVSLMRLGDILLLHPVIKNLKQRGAKVDLLINKEFAFVESYLTEVDNFHYLDRSAIQENMQSIDTHILRSFDMVQELVRNIDESNYTNICNLTHNKLSSLLLECFDTNECVTVGASSLGANNFNSPWLTYLDDRAEMPTSSSFHLIDIFAKSIGLDDYNTEISTVESENFVCAQINTAEEKKTFSNEQWRSIFSMYSLMANNTEVKVLCAPNELVSTDLIVEPLRKRGVNISVVACSLLEARDLISRSKLFLTVDTSIKYLAIGTNTPVVEVSLGSSNFRWTGAYGPRNLVLQPLTICGPCSHSLACTQKSFICQEEIPSEVVAASMHHMEIRDFNSVLHLAEEYESIHFAKTEVREDGIWTSIRLGRNYIQESLADLIEQSAWNIVLNSDLDDEWQAFDEECLGLRELFRKNIDILGLDVKACLEKLESYLLGGEIEAQEFSNKISRSKIVQQDSNEILGSIDSWVSGLPEDLQVESYAGRFQSLLNKNKGEEANHMAKEILFQMNNLFRVKRKLSESVRVDYMEGL